MSKKIGQGRSTKQYSPYILPSTPLSKTILLWGVITVCVVFVYVAGAMSLYYWRDQSDRLAGNPPTLMLVFAAEAVAPNNYNIADKLQAETQINQPDKNEYPKDDPKPQEEELKKVEEVKHDPVVTSPDDMVEELKKQEQKKEETKPATKPKPKHQAPPPKKRVQKADRNQHATAPLAYGKQGETFAAQRTSQTDGLSGKLYNDWKGKVEVKLRRSASRLNSQAGGLSGIVRVQFFYDVSGKITAQTVSSSSGNEHIDEIGLKVVRMSSPLPTPPNGAGRLDVPVQIR